MKRAEKKMLARFNGSTTREYLALPPVE